MSNGSIINDLQTMSIAEFGIKYQIPLLLKKKILMADGVDYQWAEDNWLTQNKVAWIYDEVPAIEDKKDWDKLDEDSKSLLTKLFLFFTQIEVEVNQVYLKYFLHFSFLFILKAYQDNFIFQEKFNLTL